MIRNVICEYPISLEDFNQQYKELLRLLDIDRILKENFIEWMIMLTNIVFNKRRF